MTEAVLKNVIFEILKTIAPEIDANSVSPTANLREVLDIDSFDYLKLMIGLHEKLKIEIPEADYPKLTTLGGLLQYLANKVP